LGTKITRRQTPEEKELNKKLSELTSLEANTSSPTNLGQVSKYKFFNGRVDNKV